MFKKILIANRGEIACRVIRTARRLGIATVAVHSEADADAVHVEMADQAVCIGPPPAAESYLKGGRILEAAKQSGAEAIHPGYGFLAENADFAEMAARAGIVFIGPGAGAVAAMGDKVAAKRLARRAGVNTIPGELAVVDDARRAVAAARAVGYPAMLKAAAGGGGKGMRIARSDDEVRDGFRSAGREAKSSFGDGRLLVEKYIERPRHIEIQILADGHGNVIHLGERECSIQRRHQKVVEEAPSPFIDEATREAMGAQAVALARAVDYVSAGTVEFIVDGERNFYFLEMNTRLQVEHAVTEMVTGLDLVEQMLRVAWGEKLPLTQAEVRLDGWAIEARIYAEDPLRGFLPSVGRLVRFAPPAADGFLRVDTGVCEGGEITIYYDPMIAKLVARGATRAEAIRHLRRGLDGFYIRGVSHNIGFLAAVMAHPRFVAGRLTTDFIAEEYPAGFHAADVPHEDPRLLIAVAASMHRANGDRAGETSGRLSAPARPAGDEWVAVMGGGHHPLTVRAAAGGFDVTIGGKPYAVRTEWTLGQPLFRAAVNGTAMCLQVERRGVGYRIAHAGLDADVLVLSPLAARLHARTPAKTVAAAAGRLRSPMPGLLVSLAVGVGQAVKAGEELAVVEAMKMENVLRAERDGVVAAIHAQPGDHLTVDQLILEFAEGGR